MTFQAGPGIRLSAAVAAIWAAVVAPAAAADEPTVSAKPHVPLLSTETAWSRLPPAEAKAEGPLPNWALALADALPQTTAAMLEMDYVYRTSDELPASLRAKIRWTAAHANRCRYGEAYAVADLRRAALTAAEIADFTTGRSDLSPEERAAVEFARRLTLEAYAVTDAEFAKLVEYFGEERTVALVLHVAYANFLDRLVLALGVPIEAGGALPPLAVRFRPAPAAGPDDPVEAPQPGTSGDNSPAAGDESAAPPDWSSVPYEHLQELMERQRSRAGRVSVPDWETVLKRLPPGIYPPDRPIRIRWSLAVIGHQPQLGPAWMRCLRAFGREGRNNRIYNESLFWVVTRSINCFY